MDLILAHVWKFQFHNGSIKSGQAPIVYTYTVEFQFHNV